MSGSTSEETPKLFIVKKENLKKKSPKVQQFTRGTGFVRFIVILFTDHPATSCPQERPTPIVSLRFQPFLGGVNTMNFCNTTRTEFGSAPFWIMTDKGHGTGKKTKITQMQISSP
ncbi:hypothetical protein GDO86_019305 [Hymenochirus boettgeri]|uniref:Uncharacterized protein n=1 Tax=Hymenochirus boettgeri TaxID=247094 RepID=A0A8T2IK59_9PIPI|nr:hypothetical protein GDO86_019305 [Hymenochirus boettgeri]